tara:strand:+ start:95 stop:520 length:426 start_codon:yes stop_codon:yes gene_type:complete
MRTIKKADNNVSTVELTNFFFYVGHVTYDKEYKKNNISSKDRYAMQYKVPSWVDRFEKEVFSKEKPYTNLKLEYWKALFRYIGAVTLGAVVLPIIMIFIILAGGIYNMWSKTDNTLLGIVISTISTIIYLTGVISLINFLI